MKQNILGLSIVVVLLVACGAILYLSFSLRSANDNTTYIFKQNITIPNYGSLEGKRANGVVQFFGIPYSEKLQRFRHGVYPPQPWGHREAHLRYSPDYPECVQGQIWPNIDGWVPEGPSLDNGMLSEDCAYLSMSVPERYIDAANDGTLDKLEKAAVFIYIHGGGFEMGSGFGPFYQGERIAAQGDFIQVGINYRLGAFGFFALEDEYQGMTTTGNWGLTDQRNGLRWIFDNIKYFGGDNQKITLGGQSAGGESTWLQLTSPGEHQNWSGLGSV